MQTLKAQGLEIGPGKAGKPLLYLNGRNSLELQKRLNAGGSTGTTLLIVGGVVLLLVIVAVAAGGGGLGDPCPEYEGSREHCVNP